MEVTQDKQREERYKEALKTCDCHVWVSMIKALYLRRQDRTRQGKKMTDLDERYFKTAEETCIQSLHCPLKYPGKRWRIILSPGCRTGNRHGKGMHGKGIQDKKGGLQVMQSS